MITTTPRHHKTERNNSIYKELLLLKGLFNKYIPNKRSRFGMKFFILCGVSKYLWISFIYNGKGKDRSSHRKCSLKKSVLNSFRNFTGKQA